MFISLIDLSFTRSLVANIYGKKGITVMTQPVCSVWRSQGFLMATKILNLFVRF